MKCDVAPPWTKGAILNGLNCLKIASGADLANGRMTRIGIVEENLRSCAYYVSPGTKPFYRPAQCSERRVCMVDHAGRGRQLRRAVREDFPGKGLRPGWHGYTQNKYEERNSAGCLWDQIRPCDAVFSQNRIHVFLRLTLAFLDFLMMSAQVIWQNQVERKVFRSVKFGNGRHVYLRLVFRLVPK